jgi:hypothetical protein
MAAVEVVQAELAPMLLQELYLEDLDTLGYLQEIPMAAAAVAAAVARTWLV